MTAAPDPWGGEVSLNGSAGKVSAGEAPTEGRRVSTGLVFLAALVILIMGFSFWSRAPFPPDTDPAGAYLRIVQAVNRGMPAEIFPYTEEEAQHACYTIRDYRKRSLDRARGSYPKDRLADLELTYGPVAEVPDGRDVFAVYATAQGWVQQLRRDLSGIDHVEISGKRATVVTARKTRYIFRRRPNGIWGLTAFTPTLKSEAERAARDWALIEKAAEDYAQAARRSQRETSPAH